jgi:hypothetical protein
LFSTSQTYIAFKKIFLIFSFIEHFMNEQESDFKTKKKERRKQPILSHSGTEKNKKIRQQLIVTAAQIYSYIQPFHNNKT